MRNWFFPFSLISPIVHLAAIHLVGKINKNANDPQSMANYHPLRVACLQE